MSRIANLDNAAPHVLPPLPYAEDALDPVISAQTIGFHYGKHHKGYVDTLNKLVAGTDLASLPLEKIIAKTAGKPGKAKIFDNAAQAWNHAFYWHSLRPKGGGRPRRNSNNGSRHRSARWRPARSSWRRRRRTTSAAAGHGSCSTRTRLK